MGEYAKYKGQEVKIGTCEQMYYLRHDQAHLVKALDNSVDPVRDEAHLLFRFPWPDEDSIEPGAFKNHDRELGLHDVDVPEGVEHGETQFSSTSVDGWLALLPCPMTLRATVLGTKFLRSGDVRIAQQRIRGGKLVLVCKCGACGHRYSLSTLDEAAPVIKAVRVEVERAARRDDTSGAAFYTKVRGSHRGLLRPERVVSPRMVQSVRVEVTPEDPVEGPAVFIAYPMYADCSTDGVEGAWCQLIDRATWAVSWTSPHEPTTTEIDSPACTHRGSRALHLRRGVRARGGVMTAPTFDDVPSAGGVLT